MIFERRIQKKYYKYQKYQNKLLKGWKNNTTKNLSMITALKMNAKAKQQMTKRIGKFLNPYFVINVVDRQKNIEDIMNVDDYCER